jgi:uncharacterized membrane protein YhaH (DUF805 family)
MICRNCKKLNLNDAFFCRECGEKLDTYTNSKHNTYWNRLFSGRINRRNFIVGTISIWILYFLGLFLLGFILALLFGESFVNDTNSTYMAVLAVIIAYFYNASLSIRRLHDINQSGWVLLAAVIPLVNILILCLLIFQKGHSGKNQYGNEPNPKIDLLNGFGIA